MAQLNSPFYRLDSIQNGDGWSDSPDEQESSDIDGHGYDMTEHARSNSSSLASVRTTNPDLIRQKTTWITRQMRLIERDYFIDKDQVLGEPGQFGTAFLCWRHPTSFESTKADWEPVFRCVKLINKARLSLVSEKDERGKIFKTLAREIGVLKCVDHPNIVQLFDVYENRHEIHLIMEYLPGGELFDRIADKDEGYSERQAANIIHQILDALSYLHERRIMHLDLKPENILFVSPDSEKIKLIDFGLSRVAPHFSKLRAKVGTTPYMAPEVFAGHYSLGADIWSVGIILYCIVFGYPPFSAEENQTSGPMCLDDAAKIEHLVTQVGFTPEVKPGYGPWFPEEIPVSEDLRKLISKMLTSDVKSRWTVTECLDSPWLRNSLSNNMMPQIVRDGLLKFNKHQKFKAAISAMFTDVLSQSHFDEVEKVFKTLDTNQDGLISQDEFIQGMKHVYKSDLDQNKLNQIFSNADIDNNEFLTIDELIVVAAHHALIDEDERLFNVFNEIDDDSDGVITREELLRAAKRHKRSKSKTRWLTTSDEWAQRIQQTLQPKTSDFLENELAKSTTLNYTQFLQMVHPKFEKDMTLDDWASHQTDIEFRVRASAFDVDLSFASADPMDYKTIQDTIDNPARPQDAHETKENNFLSPGPPLSSLSANAGMKQKVTEALIEVESQQMLNIPINFSQASSLQQNPFLNDSQLEEPDLYNGNEDESKSLDKSDGGSINAEIGDDAHDTQKQEKQEKQEKTGKSVKIAGMSPEEMNEQTSENDDEVEKRVSATSGDAGYGADEENEVKQSESGNVDKPPYPVKSKKTVPLGQIMSDQEVNEYQRLKQIQIDSIAWDNERTRYEMKIQELENEVNRKERDFQVQLMEKNNEHATQVTQIKMKLEKDAEKRQEEWLAKMDGKDLMIERKDEAIGALQERLDKKLEEMEGVNKKLLEREEWLSRAIESKMESLLLMDEFVRNNWSRE